MDIKGKVVIVTGASSGIGEATARQFGREGAKLVLAARRVDKLEALAQEILAMGSGAETFVVQADLSKLEDIQALIKQTLDKFGRIDVLVNNAGFGRLDWLENLDPVKDIQSQFDVNVLGVIQTTRQALPVMMKQRSGHIINMCSMAGLVATPTYTVYAACKHAVHGFSEALRREVKPWGIDVSMIYPGGVLTEFQAHAGIKRKTGATTGAWPGIQSFCGWKGSGLTGKGGLGPHYVPQFMREQRDDRRIRQQSARQSKQLLLTS